MLYSSDGSNNKLIISMNKNIFDSSVEFVNDLADFKMPYKLYGKTDLEVMEAKYSKLSGRSHGLITRLRRG